MYSFTLFLENDEFSIKDIDFTDYDIIFISGGWGAAYDLGFSELLGEKISDAYYSSQAIIGGVCHGVLGFINAKNEDGSPLIAGRKMTAIGNNRQCNAQTTEKLIAILS